MIFQAPVQNPRVKSTIRRRFHAWLCKKFGHIYIGPYYKMVQSHCRRCGAKLPAAAEQCVEWDIPWGEYA